ncbi:MAG: hypothetical protein ACRDZR_03690 [Acidimicrobiales bacterium]
MSISEGAWFGLIVGLLLAVFAVPAVARAVARRDRDPRIFRVVLASGILKLVCAPVWIYVVDHFYGGAADAYGYSGHGSQVAELIRHGDFAFHVGPLIGDGATRIITGIIYSVIGANFLGGAFIFAFLAFLSLALFYRAFYMALPEADHRRYALLLFFLPSLLFWTSAIGKDALISLGLSLAALGGARILTGRRGRLLPLASGLALTALVRPHVALIFFVALAASYIVGNARYTSHLAPLTKAFGIIVLVGGGLLLAKETAHFFGVHSLSIASVDHVLKQNAVNTGTAARTGGGPGQFGSSDTASTSLSIAALPKDFYYVVLRPLPFQAHGKGQLASSIENLFVTVLLVVSWRRLFTGLRSIRRYPYFLGAAVYSLIWIVLFASIGNLGILSREKTSLLPFLLVLVSWQRGSTTSESRLPSVATRDSAASSLESV